MAQTITKEQLKRQIDHIQDEYLDMVYQIIQVFETSSLKSLSEQPPGGANWLQFIEETYGCMQDAPLERGAQGSYEVREAFE